MTRALLATLLLFAVVQAQAPDRIARWNEDLQAFFDTLRVKQIEFTKVYPNLAEDLDALRLDIPKMRDGQIHLRLQRILAGARIAHNTAYLFAPQPLPITVRWLEDGPVIVAAAPAYKSAIGMRLLKVGPLSSTELLDALAPYISYETEYWKRDRAEDLLRSNLVLQTLNLAQGNRVDLTVEAENGPEVVPVTFATPDAKQQTLPAFPLAQSKPADTYYWSQYLSDTKTFYIQYNRCRDEPKQSFADFAAQVLSQIDESHARRVVVDLRFNTGGSSALINPLVKGLAQRRSAIGTPFVLIGQRTFSGGVSAARDLREDAKAKLVGSPTGGLQGGYAESPSFRLPKSNLEFQYSTKHFGSAREIHPDVVVTTTLADLRTGRDRVLEAALLAP